MAPVAALQPLVDGLRLLERSLAPLPTEAMRERRPVIMQNSEAGFEATLVEKWEREAEGLLRRYTLETWHAGLKRVGLREGPGWTAWQQAGGLQGTGMTHPEFVDAYNAQQAKLAAEQAAKAAQAAAQAQADLGPGLVAQLKEQGTTAMALGHTVMAEDMGIGLAFDVKHPDAIAWYKAHGAKRIAGIDDTTRDYVRSRVLKGVANGDSYQKVARDIKALYEGFGAPSPLGHIRSRAELIAVTEMGNAYVAGNMQVANRLKAEGLLMEKRWLVTGDNRVCPICRGNESEGWIYYEEAFPSGHDAPLGHPGCRCDVQLRKRPGVGGVPNGKDLKAMVKPKQSSDDVAKALISAGQDGPTAIAKKLNDLYPGENWTGLKVTHLKQKMQKQGLVPHNPKVLKPRAPKAVQPKAGQPIPKGPGFKPHEGKGAGYSKARKHLTDPGRNRGDAKDRVATNLSRRLANDPRWDDYVRRNKTYNSWGKGDSYQAASDLISNWASTSGDDNIRAIAMQLAAHDEFGLSMAARRASFDHLSDSMKRHVLDDLAQNGEGYRAFLRAMYDETQARFAAEGITELTLWRGQAIDTSRYRPQSVTDHFGPYQRSYGHKGDADIPIQLRPLSSFAADEGNAIKFSSMLAEGSVDERMVMRGIIPADRIISSSQTGFGCLNEWEFVILDSPGSLRVSLYGGRY